MITDDAIRLIMVTGGAGIGKTTMVSRLLKGIERGQLPECVGELKVDGIVYLRANAVGSLQISAANIFAGLCKLLPEKKMVQSMEALWRDSGVSIEDKMQGLFGEFCHGWIVMLLDNFESMLDPANQQQMFRIKELVLDQTLRTLLDATNHKIKVILTTQIIPDALILKYSGKVGFIELAGLPSPYAENLLRQMDMENQIGLQLATSELLYEARTWTEGHPRTLENLYAILSSDRSETLSRLVHNPLKIREYQVHALLSGEAFVLQDLYTQSILKALAVYGHPMSSALVDELIHPYFPELDSGPVLRRLIKMRLIQIDAGRYCLHPIDRIYILSQVPRGDARNQEDMSSPQFTQIALLNRAAEYLKNNFKSKGAVRSFKDIDPLLVEFDLRFEGGEYEAAAKILTDIDIKYMVLFGQSPLVIAMYERLLGNLVNPWLEEICKIVDGQLRGRCLYGFGVAQCYLGRYEIAIDSLEKASEIARSEKNLKIEGLCLAYLGNCNFYLGRISEAISYEQMVLEIADKIIDSEPDSHHLHLLADGRLGACYIFTADDKQAAKYLNRAHESALKADERRDESFYLDALGLVHCYQGQYDNALLFLDQARSISQAIGDEYGLSMHACNQAEILNYKGDHKSAAIWASKALEIGYGSLSPAIGSWSNVELAYALLQQGNIENACSAAAAACKKDAPMNNHAAFVMLGIVMLRFSNCDEARKAFVKTVELADGMLELCSQNYYALEGKGLALAGLILCGDEYLKPVAINIYKQMRKRSMSAGRLRRSLSLLASLPDPYNDLNEVRQVASGQ